MSAPKVRIYELSKQLGVQNKDVMDVLEQLGQEVKSHSSSIDQAIADKVVAHFKQGGGASSAVKAAPKTAPAPSSTPSVEENDPLLSKYKIDPGRITIRKRAAEVKEEEEAAAAAAAEKAAKDAQEAAEAKKNAPPEEAAPVEPVSEPGAEAQPPAPAVSDFGVPTISGLKIIKPAPARPAVPERPRPIDTTRPQQRPFDRSQVGRSVVDTTRPEPRRDFTPPSQPAATTVQPAAGPGARPGVRPPERETSRKSEPQERLFALQQPRGARKTRRQIEAEKAASIRRQKEEADAALAAAPKVVRIDEPIMVNELAKRLRLRDTELIKHLFMKGVMVTVNQTLDADYAREIAREFEFEVEVEEKVTFEGQYSLDVEKKKIDETQYKNLQGRAPVISIMGHVDHGKTTLLDAIRETRHKIVDTEAGGITQSIGAYTVEKDEHRIVFLDTPGHEAFTSMRMRGARSTDIAILVVAADDGVMPQTIEAINHAKAAQIPIIVAVNKIDKADADPDRVLVQLADYGLNAEKWGGDTVTCEVSALQKLGLDELLDMILLVAELLNLKADATVPAEGVVIEAQLDKRMGPVATVLVQHGTLRVGENVLVGHVGGRIRALIGDSGQRLQEAGPATPVEILGLGGVPNAGEGFQVITDEKKFKQLLADEKLRERETRLSANRAKALASGFTARTENAHGEEAAEQQFNVLVKADTQGSLEAVVDVLQRMSTDEVKVNVLHSGTGDISEADVMLASTANALIIGFNAKEDSNAERLAEQHGVLVKKYDVIYHITEDIEKWLLGQLKAETEEIELGTAEVRQIFKVGKASVIAGCYVTNGKVLRNAKAVVLRNGKEIFSGQVDNLKRFRDDAKEVASGYECGISFDRFNDLQEGDIITVYTVKEMERTSL